MYLFIYLKKNYFLILVIKNVVYLVYLYIYHIYIISSLIKKPILIYVLV
jgi:hypothetical protein